MGEQRLQRVLAAHGVASRRKAEELIRAGRVTVDGVVVRELGTKVDPQRQEIRVDGKPLRPEPRRYIMLHKPVGYITTTADEFGRKTVLDLVQVPERVVPVGRLDRDSSGLLLLTNDGDLMYRITHPRYELEKEYEVLVDGFPRPTLRKRCVGGAGGRAPGGDPTTGGDSYRTRGYGLSCGDPRGPKSDYPARLRASGISRLAAASGARWPAPSW